MKYVFAYTDTVKYAMHEITIAENMLDRHKKSILEI